MSLRVRVLVMVALLSVAFSLVACGGDPPDKEIQEAKTAIAAAQQAGADRYAAEEFGAAQDALRHAHEAVGQRDFRLALNHALDSRDRAETAAAQASAALAALKVAADRAISSAVSAVSAATARLKSAEAAHLSARTLASPRAGLADAETRVQEARTAWDKGDFAAATAAATAAIEHLSEALASLEAPPARRR